MFPVLETERLLLRELTDEDAESIFACFSDHDVTRYYGLEPLERLDQARKLIDFFAQNYVERRGIRWGIERKGGGIIGTIGFNAWVPKHKRAEIGYEIHPEHWRKGYASEAIAAIVAYGFDALDLMRIGAVVFTENDPSQKLLLKMGFQLEGVLRNYMVQSGEAHHTHVYSILKSNP